MFNFSKKYQSLEIIYDDKSKLMYTATNTETNEKVTLKLFKESDYNEIKFNELKKYIKFSHLNKNDNLLKIYSVENELYNEVSYYIIEMENIKGESLKNLIKSKTFKEDEALQIIKQLINGLSEFHRLNVVYKNLSTEKIFIDENGNVKLDPTGYIDKYNQNMKYISPEQALNKPINKTSDIYSLGIILYEMINKELPFVWENGNVELYHSMIKDFYISKSYSKNMLHILENCLYIDPNERYENLDRFLIDIASHLDYSIRVFRYDENDDNEENKQYKKLIGKEPTSRKYIDKNQDIEEENTIDEDIEDDIEKEQSEEELNEENNEIEKDKTKNFKYIKVISTCAVAAIVCGGLKITGDEIVTKLKNKNDISNINVSNEDTTISDKNKSDESIEDTNSNAEKVVNTTNQQVPIQTEQPKEEEVQVPGDVQPEVTPEQEPEQEQIQTPEEQTPTTPTEPTTPEVTPQPSPDQQIPTTPTQPSTPEVTPPQNSTPQNPDQHIPTTPTLPTTPESTPQPNPEQQEPITNPETTSPD